jgi:DNA repair protein RadD
MSKIELRDYQKSAVDAAINYIESKTTSPGIIVAPTGAGKSWEIAGIAMRYSGPILVLQPSVELLKQNYEKFVLMGGNASIFSASANEKNIGHVTYATLGSIKNRVEDFKKAGVNLVIIDECHHGIDPDAQSMFSKFIKKLNPSKVIGLTATPFRLKNNREGSRLVMLNRMRPGFFKTFIHITQIGEMIDRGFWAKSIDEEWFMDETRLVLNTTGTEFTEQSIKEAVEANGINNKIYLRIKDLLNQNNRKSILVFVDSVTSCKRFCEFIPEAKYITGETPAKERAKIVDDFKSGRVKVLFNFGVFTTGFDYPGLDCIIMGRPTNSLSSFYQIYGRGVRPNLGKDNFLFIDYCNNFKRLAHPREITIEDYRGHGWGVFTKERLVTSIPLDGPVVTKADINSNSKEVDSDFKIPFGKYKDRMVEAVYKRDPSYITWLVKQDWVSSDLKLKLELYIKNIEIKQAIA